MLLMHRDSLIARAENKDIEIINRDLMPYFLLRTGDMEGWLRDRSIDSHRTHSRILKRALRLKSKDDLDAVLYVHAATITDNYWVKSEDEDISYSDVRFKTNAFGRLALMGDVDALEYPPAPTPEVTNIGSFEKCWIRENHRWYMLKAGTPKEQFSEMFAWHAGRALGFKMADYSYRDGYVMSLDFTENGRYDFDAANGFCGEETDYPVIYSKIRELCPEAAEDYIRMCYLDALINNFDRHEYNFGLLRDGTTGKPVGFAPLFDHNLSLISRSYPKSTNYRDMLVRDFAGLLEDTGSRFAVKSLDRKTIAQILSEIPISLPRENGVYSPRAFVADYVLNRQKAIFDLCAESLRAV